MINRYRRTARSGREVGHHEGLARLDIRELCPTLQLPTFAACDEKDAPIDLPATVEHLLINGLVAQSVELRTFNP